MRYAPSPWAMKRGVPPTARKARTGELTPPGITRRARSNSSALVGIVRTAAPGAASVDVAWILRRHRVDVTARRGVVAGLAFFVFGGERPEEAVGNDVAHARTKAGIERLVEERQRLADGRVQLDTRREQRSERRRERLAGADEGRLEALELLAGDGALRR